MLEKQAKVGRVRPSRPDRGGIGAAESKSLLLSIESNGVAFFGSRVFVTVDAAPCRAQAARANVQKPNPCVFPSVIPCGFQFYILSFCTDPFVFFPSVL
jgi:hypothetical protein